MSHAMEDVIADSPANASDEEGVPAIAPTINLNISTFTTKFPITVLATSTVADLRSRLEALSNLDQVCFNGPVWIFTEDGKALRDDEIVGELAQETNLVCVTSTLRTLEARLGDLQSPGCKYTKYLRAYQGVSAVDSRILRTLWALAALAGSKTVGPQDKVDQVGGAVLMFFDAIWDSRGALREDVNVELVRNSEMTSEIAAALRICKADRLERLIAPHYSMEAHEQLLTWILERPSGEPCERGPSPRLRVAMAEFEQIRCRSSHRLLTGGGHARQVEAYRELLKVAACNPELAHMSAFGRE